MMTERDKRLIRHCFRTTEEEEVILQKKMQTFGVTNQSAFLRAMALNGYLLKVSLPEIREFIRLMKNLTNNVNQIARRMNEHGNIYETEIDEIRERLDVLWNMLNQLLLKLNHQSQP